ncbi:hypothetical protein GCM10027203_56070 [Nonomuraea fastidiosa]
MRFVTWASLLSGNAVLPSGVWPERRNVVLPGEDTAIERPMLSCASAAGAGVGDYAPAAGMPDGRLGDLCPRGR